jgi:putative spermidine/putrescine transport system permease protein
VTAADSFAVRPDRSPGQFVLRLAAVVLAASVVAYLLLPIVVTVIGSLTSQQSLTFPPEGLSLRWYGEFFSSPEWRRAAVNSLVIGGTACAVATVVGTALAYVITQQRGRVRDTLLAASLTPLVVPYVVVAVALYPFFADWRLLNSRLGVALAHSVIGVPFVILSVLSALRPEDLRLAQAARTLGATRTRAFFHVVLPLMLPGVVAGAAFAFAVSLDDVVMPLFLGGIEGETLPKKMLEAVKETLNPTVMAISALIVGAGILMLLISQASAMLRRTAD